MPKIEIIYDIPSRTFTAIDESDNQVNFQTVPDGVERPVKEAVSRGVRPMQGLLMSLGTCSGIDIISILEKQRQEFTSFKLLVTAEREKDVIPALWVKANVQFILSGLISEEKAARAAELSIEKYCSVAETLRRAGCVISYSVVIE